MVQIAIFKCKKFSNARNFQIQEIFKYKKFSDTKNFQKQESISILF